MKNKTKIGVNIMIRKSVRWLKRYPAMHKQKWALSQCYYLFAKTSKVSDPKSKDKFSLTWYLLSIKQIKAIT